MCVKRKRPRQSQVVFVIMMKGAKYFPCEMVQAKVVKLGIEHGRKQSFRYTLILNQMVAVMVLVDSVGLMAYCGLMICTELRYSSIWCKSDSKEASHLCLLCEGNPCADLLAKFGVNQVDKLKVITMRAMSPRELYFGIMNLNILTWCEALLSKHF
ncbi:hypothetical protein VNO78_33890 [Psophocarpus tetragonolobus]|uniref:Uncharacterized protein n=1 Tax=Psophocarpus tetragonolobus TaxID=3891 RepID=A0AAN9RQY8_PSOTE